MKKEKRVTFMAELKRKRKKVKGSRNVTPEQVKAIMDANPKKVEEAKEEVKTSQQEIIVAKEPSKEEKVKKEEREETLKKQIAEANTEHEKVYMIKKFSRSGEMSIIGFMTSEVEARWFCKLSDKEEKREGAYTYEELNVIHPKPKDAEPYYQHLVRFKVRDEIGSKNNHQQYDGDMCVEPNNYVKYVGVKYKDDVVLFHNTYITTLSVRTVQNSRSEAEAHAKTIYEQFLMYYSITNDYEKAYHMVLTKLGIKDKDFELAI